MKEQWKSIKGYAGYEVSNLGNVRTRKYGRKRNLVLLKTNQGYHRVCLYRDDGRDFVSVHRLVAEAFIPNPGNKPQVNHKNGIRTDNDARNLEWTTASENLFHKYRVLGAKTNPPKKPIICVETGEVYDSETAAANDKGLSQGNIAHVLTGVAHTCGGYHWQYVTKQETA